MSALDIELMVLAVLLQAPFAFRLGFVVRDGRQWLLGGLFLALGSAVAALAVGLSGSLLLAVPAALAAVFILAHARFRALHRPPSAPASQPVPAPPSAVPPAPPGGTPSPPIDPNPQPTGSRLLHGMAFVSEVLLAADRIGELRHRRRLRKLERQRAERQAGGRLAPQVRRPPFIRMRPTRGIPKLPPPK